MFDLLISQINYLLFILVFIRVWFFNDISALFRSVLIFTSFQFRYDVLRSVRLTYKSWRSERRDSWLQNKYQYHMAIFINFRLAALGFQIQVLARILFCIWEYLGKLREEILVYKTLFWTNSSRPYWIYVIHKWQQPVLECSNAFKNLSKKMIECIKKKWWNLALELTFDPTPDGLYSLCVLDSVSIWLHLERRFLAWPVT